MSAASDCIRPDALSALVAGSLPAGETSRLERHLESCAACQQALADLIDSDGAAARVAGHLRATVADLTPSLARAAERLGRDAGGHDPGERERFAAGEHDDAPSHAIEYLDPPDRPDSLGRLGRYAISEVVGHGGMGVVFKAHDPKLNRVVAIKVLAPALAGYATARKRFLREAQAAAAITHQNVVTIHAVEEDRLPYLVMEYVDGQSLETKINRQGPLTPKEILRIGTQVAAGLAAAHAHGLIHRDIKPANILLENGVERVRITDFGLARAVNDATLTRTGDVPGTPQYMSPEQAQGHTVDARSDLFSLGCVLYAMCTGRSPFRADTTLAALRRVCDDVPRPIHEINSEIPDWLTRIIDRLLAKDPADRFQPAVEVAALLARHLAHVQDPASVPLPEQGRPLRSGRRPWSLAAGFLLVAAAALTLMEAAGVTRVLPTLRIARDGRLEPQHAAANGARASPDHGAAQAPASTESASTEPPPSVLDALRPDRIPPEQRFDRQPAELVQVLGTRAGWHWNEPTCLTLSPDGKLAASAGYDGHIYVWEAETLRLRSMLAGHGSWAVWGLAFLPDGRRLLSAGDDKLARLWDLETGREIRQFTGHTGHVWDVAGSHDGRRALSVGLDGTLRLWDVETGEQLHCFDARSGGLVTVAFSSDGSRALTGGTDSTMRLWDLEARQEVRRFDGHTHHCRRVRFLPDGRRAISCSHDKTVRLWDLDTGDEIRRFTRHTDEVYGLDLSTDGRRAISTGRDGSIRVWDLQAGAELLVLRRPTPSALSSVVFSPDARRAISGGHDYALRLWDLDSGTELQADPLMPSEKRVWRVCFSYDGRHVLACMGSNFARLWDVESGRELHTLEQTGRLRSVALTPDGRHALCGGEQGLDVWNVETGQELRRFEGARNIWDIAVSRDGRTVLTGDHNGQHGALRLWQFETGQELQPFRGHQGAVLSAALSGDGRRALSGGWDRIVRLWDLDSGNVLHQWQHSNAVWTVTLSPDGRFAAAGDEDGFVRLWDISATPPLLRRLPKAQGFVRAVAFSPDSRTLASVGHRQIIVWDLASDSPLHEWQFPGDVMGASFAPDGRHLATANVNGTVYILRLAHPGQPDSNSAVHRHHVASRKIPHG